jgi:hypothetical protein
MPWCYIQELSMTWCCIHRSTSDLVLHTHLVNLAEEILLIQGGVGGLPNTADDYIRTAS